MKQKKVPFYRDLIASIKDFDKYEEFFSESTNNAIKYFLKLTLLLSIVVAIAITIKAGQTVNKTINYIKDESPYFKYDNKEFILDSEDAIIYENSENIDGIIIVDTKEITDEKMEEYKKKFALYNNGILLTKNKVTIKSASLAENVEQTYEEILKPYGIDKFDKDGVIQYFSNSRIISVYISMFITFLIALFILYIIDLLIEALTPMIFGFISSIIIGLRLKVSHIFNITVHATSLSVILRMIYVVVNLLTGFYIKYFDTMYITIIYIYIITALFIIKSNLIKEQIELMKIIEEQKNVREELKEQDKEKEEPKEDKKEENKNKKENGEKEEDNNIGKEANGEV